MAEDLNLSLRQRAQYPITVRQGGDVYTLLPGETIRVPARLAPYFLARGAKPVVEDTPDETPGEAPGEEE